MCQLSGLLAHFVVLVCGYRSLRPYMKVNSIRVDGLAQTLEIADGE